LDAIDGGAVLENQPAYLKALQSYLGGTWWDGDENLGEEIPRFQ
jgi:hypothetical protein